MLDLNDKLELDHEQVTQEIYHDQALTNAAFLSIAISLKRIADALCSPDKYGMTGSAAISQAIVDGLREGR